MVQKRETKAINKHCVREILSLSFGWGGSREDTHAHCVFHACRLRYNLVPRASFSLTSGRKTRALGATISGMRHSMK